MTNTDSTPFMNATPSISLRENERGMHIGPVGTPTGTSPPTATARSRTTIFALA